MPSSELALTKSSQMREPLRLRDRKNFFSGRVALAAAPRRGEFTASRRHSVRVLWLRRGIIVFCCFLAVLIGSFVVFDPFRRLPKNVSIGQVSMDGTKVIIASPKIAGLQQNGRAYEITSLSGNEDILKPNIIELNGVNAKIGLADASKLQILAANGIYDSETNEVLLNGDVSISNATNYNIKMRQAVLNFKTNVLNSETLIAMDIDGGSITGQAITISENGDRISFARDVHSIFQTGSVEKAAE
jgi:lipopolysaccharide export system protein LptC